MLLAEWKVLFTLGTRLTPVTVSIVESTGQENNIYVTSKTTNLSLLQWHNLWSRFDLMHTKAFSIFPLSVSVFPALSEAFAKKNSKKPSHPLIIVWSSSKHTCIMCI